jgi:multidrug resistance efflux pump
MKTLRRQWRTLALFVVCGLLLTVIARSAMAGPSTTPRPSDRVRAERHETPPGQQPDPTIDRPDGDWVGGLGLVEPHAPETRLGPDVGGRIAVIHVTEGQFVTAGTVLVEIDAGPEQAALAAAEATVAVREAELARARRGLRPEELAAITSETEGARARAALSQGVLERLEAAAAGGGATRDEVERARQQADADRFAAETAASRQLAGHSGRREDVLVAMAQLRVAEAQRAQQQAELDLHRIVAPIDGQILEIHNRVGEYVAPGGTEPVVVMGDTRQLRVRVDVDERDIARIAMGASGIITADAFGDRQFHGHVVEIGHRMGRKNLRTDEPTERIDTKILEVVMELEEGEGLVPGLRVMAYLAPSSGASSDAAPAP